MSLTHLPIWNESDIEHYVDIYVCKYSDNIINQLYVF